MFNVDAWGNHKTFVLDNGQFVDFLTQTSYTQSGLNNKLIAQINPFRYRSYYYDSETGLYYLNSRYYDPQIGRFINADDISVLSEGKNFFNGLNLYAYCGNNPIMNIDEFGNAWWDWLLGIVVIVAAIVLSVATAGIGTIITGALGGGLTASIIGGAIGGAISGAVASFGTSLAIQGISNGFNNINWVNVGLSTLTGFVSGAILGGIGGAIKYFSSTTKLYRAVSEAEYNSIKSTGKFSLGKGQMEGKFFATTKSNALTWGSKLGSNKIVSIRVLKSSLTHSSITYFNMLDNIGKAYYFSDMSYLNNIIKTLFLL